MGIKRKTRISGVNCEQRITSQAPSQSSLLELILNENLSFYSLTKPFIPPKAKFQTCKLQVTTG